MNPVAQQRAAALAPRAMRPVWQSQALNAGVAIAILGILVGMAIDLQLTPDVLGRGLGKMGRILGAMVPPNDGGDLARIVTSLAETFAMAVAGTVLAVMAALPLGLLGAKTVVAQPMLHFAFRRVLDLFRGVPALVWALILVSAFGLGPFGGVIALALADIPNLAKLFAEATENADSGPVEGVRSAGASPVQVIRYGLAPQVTPVLTSQSLFFLESNFRNAAVLGIVGAGGIGFELDERIRIYAFDQAAFIILLYMVCVALLDTACQWLRQRLA